MISKEKPVTRDSVKVVITSEGYKLFVNGVENIFINEGTITSVLQDGCRKEKHYFDVEISDTRKE